MMLLRSKNLIGFLRSGDKIEIAELTSKMMPNGNPDFRLTIGNCAPIRMIAKESGTKPLRALLYLIVKNFCESVNVVRNMTEDQMIEAASMLIDECYDYSIEDYIMMFTMAKRGKLSINDGKGVMDRVDLEVVGKIFTAYDTLRSEAKERIQEEQWRGESKESNQKQIGTSDEKQKQNFSKAFSMLRKMMEDAAKEREEAYEQKRKDEELKKQNWLERFQQWAVENEINIDDFKPKK